MLRWNLRLSLFAEGRSNRLEDFRQNDEILSINSLYSIMDLLNLLIKTTAVKTCLTYKDILIKKDDISGQYQTLNYKYDSQMDKVKCFTPGCTNKEGKFYYCCRETESFCYTCSKSICEKCSQKRTKPIKKLQIQPQNQQSKCDRCQSKLQKQNSIQFKNCKHWLCKDCICKKSKMQIVQGIWDKYSKKCIKCFCPTNNEEMNVQEVLNRFCFCCGQNSTEKTKLLKNGVKMREICIKTLLFGSKMKEFQSDRNQLSKQDLIALVYTCENCSKIIGADEISPEEVSSEISCSECSFKMSEILIKPGVSTKSNKPFLLPMERANSWSDGSKPFLKTKMKICEKCGMEVDGEVRSCESEALICYDCNEKEQNQRTDKIERELQSMKMNLEAQKRKRQEKALKKEKIKEQKKVQQSFKKSKQSFEEKDNKSKEQAAILNKKTDILKQNQQKTSKSQQSLNERSIIESSLNKQTQFRRIKQAQLDETIRIRLKKQQQFQREISQIKRKQASLRELIDQSFKKESQIKHQLSQMVPNQKKSSFKLNNQQTFSAKQEKKEESRCAVCNELCYSDILSTYSQELDISLCRPCYDRNIQYSTKAQKRQNSIPKLKPSISNQDRRDIQHYDSQLYRYNSEDKSNKSHRLEGGYSRFLKNDYLNKENISIHKLQKIKNDWKQIMNRKISIEQNNFPMASIVQQFADQVDLFIEFPKDDQQNCSKCGYYLLPEYLITNKQNKPNCLRCYLAYTAQSN